MGKTLACSTMQAHIPGSTYNPMVPSPTMPFYGNHPRPWADCISPKCPNLWFQAHCPWNHNRHLSNWQQTDCISPNCANLWFQAH